jgi:hypothetical protein
MQSVQNSPWSQLSATAIVTVMSAVSVCFYGCEVKLMNTAASQGLLVFVVMFTALIKSY